MSITVANIANTGGRTCGCTSWLAHWERYVGSTASYCAGAGCVAKSDLVGGHVRRPPERDWLIVPLCKQHNGIKAGEEYEVETYTKFVSANVARTCG